MKKIFLTSIVLFTFTFIACDINNDIQKSADASSTSAVARGTNSNIECNEVDGVEKCRAEIFSNNNEDGNVSSLFGANPLPDGDMFPYKIGREKIGYMATDYKSILSFDTSVVPASAEITRVFIPTTLSVTSADQSVDYEEIVD